MKIVLLLMAEGDYLWMWMANPRYQTRLDLHMDHHYEYGRWLTLNTVSPG